MALRVGFRREIGEDRSLSLSPSPDTDPTAPPDACATESSSPLLPKVEAGLPRLEWKKATVDRLMMKTPIKNVYGGRIRARVRVVECGWNNKYVYTYVNM